MNCLKALGFNIDYEIYALENRWSPTDCSTGVLNQTCTGGVQGPNENWGPAIAERIASYSWRPGATRIIIPISDEGPYCGDGCNNDDENSIIAAYNAVNAADPNIFVFPIAGTDWSGNTVRICFNGTNDAMDRLVNGTNANDKKFEFTGDPDKMAKDISEAVIIATWDSDGDCFVPANCPCDPNNPPSNPNCPNGVMLCNDWVDTQPCINPSSTEAMLPATSSEYCDSVDDVAKLFGIRKDYICNFNYYGYDCNGIQRGICAVNCGDNFDNDQNTYTDVFDESCPLTGGIVPCGRMRDDPTTIEFENCPCRLCHFLILGDKIIDFILFKIILPLAVLIIVVGGIMFLTAGGIPEKISKAKKLMTTVAIGVLIIFAAWLIVNTILMLIGIADWTNLKEWWKIECPVPSVCCKYRGKNYIPCFKVNEPCKLPWES
jgi:hypothetical protein